MRTLLLTIFVLPAILLAELATFKPVLREEDAVVYLDLDVEIAPGAHVFAESFAVRFPQGVEASLARPLPTELDTETESQVLVGKQTISYILSQPAPKPPFEITIDWQGCSGEVCLQPQSTVFVINGDGTSQLAASQDVGQAPSPALGGFKVVAMATGYLSPKQFVDFCKKAETTAQAH